LVLSPPGGVYSGKKTGAGWFILLLGPAVFGPPNKYKGGEQTPPTVHKKDGRALCEGEQGA